VLSCSGVAGDLLKIPCGLRLMVSVTISIVTSCCQWKWYLIRYLKMFSGGWHSECHVRHAVAGIVQCCA
ncbi:hypothetical protein, partial [Escherichia coli]|uniref:hypothetical protein n=1 Tax=Escherichia coli TaxID=562 RepID=UPI001E34EF12